MEASKGMCNRDTPLKRHTPYTLARLFFTVDNRHYYSPPNA
jgi:hypothetical protein